MSTEPTAARVISKDGNVSTGWVINGQTFKDQGGTQRIDSGSTVELNDGRSWVYNDKTGGVPTAQTTRNNYANTTDYSSYDNALNTMQSGIDSRASAQRAAYNRQADKIRRDAEIAKKEAREAYIQASNPYGPIGQRLEALGLGDSGYAETTYARLGNQYQKLLSDQARATEDALAGIYGDIEAAYAQADYDRAMAAANIMLQKDSAKRSDNQFLANMDLTNSQNAIANNQYDQSRQDQLNRYAIEDARYDAEKAYQQRYDALALIMSGYIDEPTAKAAGMTEAEAMARYRQYLANQPVTTRSSGGSGQKNGNNKGEASYSSIIRNKIVDFVEGKTNYKDVEEMARVEWKKLGYDSQAECLIDLRAAQEKYNGEVSKGQEMLSLIERTMQGEGITDTNKLIQAYMEEIEAAYQRGEISPEVKAHLISQINEGY